MTHAQDLAEAVPNARFSLIEGGHNEWALPGRVKLQCGGSG